LKYLYRADTYYDLPTTKMRRTCSFGFGLRAKVEIKQQGPPPNTYDLPSVFDCTRKKGKVFNFAPHPGTITKPSVSFTKDIPGPGTYNVIQAPGKGALKFSFLRKISSPCILFIS
jgi:hypothetical protein